LLLQLLEQFGLYVVLLVHHVHSALDLALGLLLGGRIGIVRHDHAKLGALSASNAGFGGVNDHIDRLHILRVKRGDEAALALRKVEVAHHTREPGILELMLELQLTVVQLDASCERQLVGAPRGVAERLRLPNQLCASSGP
jgi:hypothetical protein